MWTISTGEKGGSGKTLMSIIAIDWHIKHDKQKPILIDTDTSNAELFETYAVNLETVHDTHEGKRCDLYGYDIKTENGRLKTVRLLTELTKSNPDRNIVINVGAGMGEYIAKFKGAFANIPSVTLWTINRDKSCIRNLKKFLNISGDSRICVIKNGYHGANDDFYLYTSTNTSKRVPSVFLPRGPNLLSDYCYSGRTAMHDLENAMEIMEWWETDDWINQAGKVYEKIMKIAAPALPEQEEDQEEESEEDQQE